MDVIIHSIEYSQRAPDVIELGVSIGGKPIARYRASLSEVDPGVVYCNVESELFMALSDIAHSKYARCTVFQIELTGILKAFSNDRLDLELPVKLGTTQYCVLKPTILGVGYNKIRNFCTFLLWSIGIRRPKGWVN